MKKKLIIVGSIILVLIIGIILFLVLGSKNKLEKIKVDLTELKYEKDGEEQDLRVYKQDGFEDFLKDYEEGNLPNIYITEFLFDGVSMYKAYDLDDFIEKGNDIEVKTQKITTLNIIRTGEYELTGELTGMIAVNSNDLDNDIKIVLNNVKLDTDSKKVPAIYVYNKDINYTKHTVTISAKEGTKNYIEGGKLKKVSLIPSDDLSNYSSKYSGENKTNYETYTNYYGVYTAKQIENILFAKETADNEDLQDGDPYYYYKASGSISSDIDLYFEGKGYLEVTSKNKEGIETKGNLTFSGGTGDYVVYAQDDCLNTTTEGNDSRNDLTIDVKSLKAVVSLEADEGDAIDSNGTLTINGGEITALAKPGQDSGIDSGKGIYINGGIIIATGNMYDEIKEDSEQAFVVFSFGTKVDTDNTITMKDEDGKEVFSYTTDREYTYLVYSSDKLEDGKYTLYKGDEQLAYTSKSSGGFGPGGQGGPGGQQDPGQNGQPPEMPNGGQQGPGGNMQPPQGNPPEKPNGNVGDPTQLPNNGEITNPTPPEMPNGDNGMTPPNMPDGQPPEIPNGDNGMTPPDMPDGQMPNGMGGGNTTATNKDFEIDGTVNIFNGVAKYSNE